jgi:hypothetical protein
MRPFNLISTALLVGAALLAPACGYHRLDRQPRNQAWHHKGDTLRLAPFKNITPRLGVEERFEKALSNRVIAASPWKLVGKGEASRWILQGTLEKYEVRPVGISLGQSLGNDKLKGTSAGSASRVEVIVVASVELLDGQTGAVVQSRRGLTFSNQYRVDQNFASFDNRELAVVDSLADDFAESFLTQFLEGAE